MHQRLRQAGRAITTRLMGEDNARALRVWLRINVRNELATIPPGAYEGKVVFIAIPKTAGSSVAGMPVFTVTGHKTWRFYARKIGIGNLPTTFTVVRHPYARVVSAYNYLRYSPGNAMDAWWTRRHLMETESVEDFVRHHLRKTAVLRWLHFRPQAEFVVDGNGRVRVDQILRFESLERDWRSFAADHGLPEVLPHRKKSSHRPQPLSAEARAVVRDVYKDDFELLGYDE